MYKATNKTHKPTKLNHDCKIFFDGVLFMDDGSATADYQATIRPTFLMSALLTKVSPQFVNRVIET